MNRTADEMEALDRETATRESYALDVEAPAAQTATREKFARRAREEVPGTKSADFSKLSPEQQAIAWLGHEQPVGANKLPKGARIVTITADRKKLHSEILPKLAVTNLFRQLPNNPTRSNLDGNDAETITLLIPAEANVFHLLKFVQEQQLPKFQMRLLDDDLAATLRIGKTVVPLHPRLNELADDPESDSPDTALKTVSPSGKIGWMTQPAPALLQQPATYWAANDVSSEAIASAGEEPLISEEINGASCQYLSIDINALLDTTRRFKSATPIISQLIALSESDDYLTTTDTSGNIILTSVSPRAGGSLDILAKSLKTATEEKVTLVRGRGTIALAEDRKSFSISGYPSKAILKSIRKSGRAGIFTKESDHEIDQAGRDITLAKRETQKSDTPGILEITDVKQEVSLRTSKIPRTFIGFGEETKRMNTLTNFSGPTRLILVKGQAGIGKSTFLDEWKKTHPNTVVLSLDPGGETIPGQSLVTVANQIGQAIKAKLEGTVQAKYLDEINPLLEYCEKSEPDKLTEAQNEPQLIGNYCLKALQAVEKMEGAFYLLLDDVHHVDRHSDSHITDLVYNFLNKSKASKAILSMRPEERYQTGAQRNLEIKVAKLSGSANAVEDMYLEDPQTHAPKLNLRDPKNAFDFVWNSLPEDILMGPDGQPRELVNDWHLKLAAKVTTPLDFRTLMSIIISNPKRNLIVTDHGIDLHEKTMQLLDKVKNSEDISIELVRRIKKLPATQKGILRSMALIGTRASASVLFKLIDGKEADKPRYLEQLRKNGYILEEGGEGQAPDHFRLQHDTVRSLILSSIPEKALAELALSTHEKIKDDPEIHSDAKLAILQHTTARKDFSDTQFWSTYTDTASRALNEAANKKSYSRSYSLATSVVGDFEGGSKSTIARTLGEIDKNPGLAERLPGQIRSLMAQALTAIAKNGVYLGNKTKVYKSIELLEKLGAQAELQEAYFMGFEAAYMPPTELKELADYHDKLTASGLTGGSKEIADIKLQFKKAKTVADFQACNDTIRAKSAAYKSLDREDQLEIVRLNERIALEKMMQAIKDNGYDEDVMMEPAHLNEVGSRNVLKVLNNLLAIYSDKKSRPQGFKPIDELYMVEQIAQLQAILGHHQQALETFGELWRIANQMEIYPLAARAAKLKGDIECMQGIGSITAATEEAPGTTEKLHEGTILRTSIVKAIDTYTKQGLAVSRLVSNKNNSYHSILPTQRLRAVGILVSSYDREIEAALGADPVDQEELASIKEELIPYLKMALEDFYFLNFQSNWKNHFEEDGELGYYISSSYGYVVSCIKALGLTKDEIGSNIPTIKDLPDTPAFKEKSLREACKKTKVKRDRIGEVNRKSEGLRRLINSDETEFRDSLLSEISVSS